MELLERVKGAVAEANRLKERVVAEQGETIVAMARLLADALRQGGKILFFGNGGSAADAQHLAAELVNRFQMERRPLAGLALTTDTSVLTSIANDYDFQEIFAKQVRALGRRGDVAVGLSTSGTSQNVVQGLKAARELGLVTLALSGRDGGPVAEAAELAVVVPSQSTPRIQEVHLAVGHILCELVEVLLFPEAFSQAGTGRRSGAGGNP